MIHKQHLHQVYLLEELDHYHLNQIGMLADLYLNLEHFQILLIFAKK